MHRPGPQYLPPDNARSSPWPDIPDSTTATCGPTDLPLQTQPLRLRFSFDPGLASALSSGLCPAGTHFLLVLSSSRLVLSTVAWGIVPGKRTSSSQHQFFFVFLSCSCSSSFLDLYLTQSPLSRHNFPFSAHLYLVPFFSLFLSYAGHRTSVSPTSSSSISSIPSRVLTLAVLGPCGSQAPVGLFSCATRCSLPL